MPSTVELTGRPAAPGLAQGRLHLLDDRQHVERVKGTPAAEAEALNKALEDAVADLAALAADADDDAAAMLAFQMAMLEDEELSAPAQEAIALGVAADRAWLEAIGAQIANYESSDDDYFRARAADLKDMRDRVLGKFGSVDQAVVEPGSILVGDDITPTRFLGVDWSRGGGIALFRGSASSHVAILARARGVPMVVGLGDVTLDPHSEALLDGAAGRVILSPDGARKSLFLEGVEAQQIEAARLADIARHPATTADGTRIQVMINVARPDDLAQIDVETCDGIGLMRTEFLFGHGPHLPDEDMQYAAYRRLLEWAAGRSVTIRTLDAGADKPIAGLTIDGESNPFLGVRGIRLSLSRPDIFRVQLRALARAAIHGPLKVMWPMVAVPRELEQAAALFDEELSALRAAGIAAERPALGMMVEVPAPAIAPDLFAAADFFSVGSNDLIQYVAAASRDSDALAEIGSGSLPVILRMIRHLTEFGQARDMDVSICGDLASDPAIVPLLIRAGLRTCSVAPAAIGSVKDAISRVDLRAGDGKG